MWLCPCFVSLYSNLMYMALGVLFYTSPLMVGVHDFMIVYLSKCTGIGGALTSPMDGAFPHQYVVNGVNC